MEDSDIHEQAGGGGLDARRDVEMGEGES